MSDFQLILQRMLNARGQAAGGVSQQDTQTAAVQPAPSRQQHAQQAQSHHADTQQHWHPLQTLPQQQLQQLDKFLDTQLGNSMAPNSTGAGAPGASVPGQPHQVQQQQQEILPQPQQQQLQHDGPMNTATASSAPAAGVCNAPIRQLPFSLTQQRNELLQAEQRQQQANDMQAQHQLRLAEEQLLQRLQQQHHLVQAQLQQQQRQQQQQQQGLLRAGSGSAPPPAPAAGPRLLPASLRQQQPPQQQPSSLKRPYGLIANSSSQPAQADSSKRLAGALGLNQQQQQPHQQQSQQQHHDVLLGRQNGLMAHTNVLQGRVVETGAAPAAHGMGYNSTAALRQLAGRDSIQNIDIGFLFPESAAEYARQHQQGTLGVSLQQQFPNTAAQQLSEQQHRHVLHMLPPAGYDSSRSSGGSNSGRRLLPHSLSGGSAGLPYGMLSGEEYARWRQQQQKLLEELQRVGRGACGSSSGVTVGGSNTSWDAANRMSTQPPGQQRMSGAEAQAALKAVIEVLDVTGHDEAEPPETSLMVPLLRHQKLALAWMCRREQSRRVSGGILADDQGLGKTVTTIALILAHPRDGEYLQDIKEEGASDEELEQLMAAAGASGAKQQHIKEVVDLVDDNSPHRLAPNGKVKVTYVNIGSSSDSGNGSSNSELDILEMTEHDSKPSSSPAGTVAGGAAANGGSGSQQSGKQPASQAEQEAGQPMQQQQQQQQLQGCEQLPAAPMTQPHTILPTLDAQAMLGDSLQRPTAQQPSSSSANSQQQQQQQHHTDSNIKSTVNAILASHTAAEPTAADNTALVMADGGHDSDVVISSLVTCNGKAKAGGAAAAVSKARAAAEAATAAEAGLVKGATLVVCPTSLLHQWARELRHKVHPAAGCLVHIYHSKEKALSPEALSDFTVVLTTYGTMALEAPEKDKEAAKGKGKKQQVAAAADGIAAAAAAAGNSNGAVAASLVKPAAQNAGGPLFRVLWHRVVLDEAQSIKNARTLAAHAAWSLHARHRWCLSGTPIQNSVDDLFSYFRFLHYEPFNHPTYFKLHIKEEITNNPTKGFKKLQTLLRAILLRRTKGSKLGGQPIIQLPERRQELAKVAFSRDEQAFYKQVEAEAKASLERMQGESGGKGAGSCRNYINMLYQLLRLRQACNHPWLVKGGPAGAGGIAGRTGAPTSSAADVAAVRKLAPDTQAALLQAIQGCSSMCGACGDIPEDPSITRCCHVYCRQCLATRLNEGLNSNEGLGNDSLGFNCLVCGSPVRSGDAFRGVAIEAAAAAVMGAGGLSSSSSSGGNARVGKGNRGKSSAAASSVAALQKGWKSSSKVDKVLDLLSAIRQRNQGVAAAAAAAVAAAAAAAVKATPLAARSKTDSLMLARMRRIQSGSPTEAVAVSSSNGARSSSGGCRSRSTSVSADGSREGTPSTAAAMAAAGRQRPEKVIVFSQWTSMLDLLEIPLKKGGFGFRRLDGTMTVAAREKAIADFESSSEVMALIVSLKAAALGLNLTIANHVVLVDLWWNPTTEEQAIDRAHRIGQIRPVQVTRITVPGTVEERILELQDKKRSIVEAALAEGADASAAANRLTMDDLFFLFGGSS